MASSKIVDIKGIGEQTKDTLVKEMGLKTVDSLLEAGASKKGREEIAEKTGLDEKKILRWVNMADLFRIKGVAESYSNLLELAGVDTVKELRNRVPANLHAKMLEVAAQHKGVVKRVPRIDEVESWVAQAKEMDPKVTH
jgi:predicted flap endonuclease-1-like 5' DNA nuclease